MFTRQKEDQKEQDWLNKEVKPWETKYNKLGNHWKSDGEIDFIKEYSEDVKLPIKVIPVKDWTLPKALWYRLNKPLGWFGMSVIAIYFMSALLAFLSLWVWNNFIIK